MAHNIQRLHCAIEIDILLGKISSSETFGDNARADDLTIELAIMKSNIFNVNESYLRSTI